MCVWRVPVSTAYPRTRESLPLNRHPVSYRSHAKPLRVGDSVLCGLVWGPCSHTCFHICSWRGSKVPSTRHSPLAPTVKTCSQKGSEIVSGFWHPQLALLAVPQLPPAPQQRAAACQATESGSDGRKGGRKGGGKSRESFKARGEVGCIAHH